MPRWNFGSPCHYSVTERLCWHEKDSPCIARISHGNFTGTPGPLRYAEHHRVGDKGIHRTGGVGASRRRPGWGQGGRAALEWNPVAQARESRGEIQATSGPWNLAGASCDFAQFSVILLWKVVLLPATYSRKEEEGVMSSSCSDVLGTRHFVCRDCASLRVCSQPIPYLKVYAPEPDLGFAGPEA